jgi:hypothetical protein
MVVSLVTAEVWHATQTLRVFERTIRAEAKENLGMGHLSRGGRMRHVRSTTCRIELSQHRSSAGECRASVPGVCVTCRRRGVRHLAERAEAEHARGALRLQLRIRAQIPER